MPNYTRVRLKISEHRTYGVMNQNLSSICMYGGARQTILSVYIHLWNTFQALSRFTALFQPLLLGLLSKLLEKWKLKSTISFKSAMEYRLENVDRRTHNAILSVVLFILYFHPFSLFHVSINIPTHVTFSKQNIKNEGRLMTSAQYCSFIGFEW